MHLQELRGKVAKALQKEARGGKKFNQRKFARVNGLPYSKVHRAYVWGLNNATETPYVPFRKNQIEDKDALLKALGSKKDVSFHIEELCDKIKRPPERVQEILETFKNIGLNIYQDGEYFSLTREDDQGSRTKQVTGDSFKFGAISDTHLGCKHERIDALRDLYDWYASEGIQIVYHGGNIIEGEARFNVMSRYVHGMDNQIHNMLEKYPKRNGIITKFICGDDHEGWYQQREGISIGKHIEQEARGVGRYDLQYMGYHEHDIELVGTAGSCVLRIVHGCGGGSYAISHRIQKYIESLQGGEKPAILLVGHHHKMEHLPTVRNVEAFQLGCTVDQTTFLRKKVVECHVGGWIIQAKQCPKSGAIKEVWSGCRKYFNKGFYQEYD
jgi:hypothetical protein